MNLEPKKRVEELRTGLSKWIVSHLISLGGRAVVPSLGGKQVLFLEAVCELKEDAYGLRIAVWFEETTRKPVNIGQIYSIAKGLAGDALIEGTEKAAPSGRGRPVIVYALTEVGHLLHRAARLRLAGGGR